MKRRIFVLCFLFLFVSLSVTAHGAEFSSAGNLFLANSTIDLSNNVKGDLVIVGSNLMIKSPTGGDILAAGSNVTISGPVGGNIRAAGSNLTIESDRVKNITAAGSSVTFGKAVNANGIYVAGSTVTFMGNAIDLSIAGSTATIDGTVTGNLILNCNTVTIGDNANIGGKIIITSDEMPKMNGKIEQEKILFTPSKESQRSESAKDSLKLLFILGTILWGIASATLLAVIMTPLLSGFIQKSQQRIKRKTWLTLLIGLVAFIVIPIASILLLFTVIGIAVSILSLIFYAILLFLAPVFTGVTLGQLLMGKMNKYLSAIIGTIAICIVLNIPFLNGLVWFGAVCFTLGSVVLSFFKDHTPLAIEPPQPELPPQPQPEI